MKPVRGSSPTASLAADLSQNFHIDQSPHFPTPRRSLFTSSNLFGTVDGRESMTTPPLPSSSPAPGNDSMDISPLPHKAPFFSITEVEAQSPTPDTTSTDDSMTSLCMQSPVSPLEAVKPNPFVERRRNSLLRPSLARSKGYSTNSIPSRNSMENPLPAFKFGHGSKQSNSTPLTLDQCFGDSPPQDRKTASGVPQITLMGPPRPKQPFSGMTGTSRANGSPGSGHIRKPSTSLGRPRKQFRRSLSMFEHPEDVMRQEKREYCPAETMQSIMDVDDSHKLRLPHFVPEDQPDSLPRITKGTLIDILDGHYLDMYDEVVIVDCRFEYEYQGGHIDGALNYNDKEVLASKLFDLNTTPNTLLVFHCEYSAHRAPIMAKFVRHRDRAVNASFYPRLTYPEVYILDGGYSSFFADHRARCYPQNYVAMSSEEHAHACERGMGKLRQRTKLSRAQTFAFGQHSQMDESPTAPSRSSNVDDSMMGMDIATDTSFEHRRSHVQRMASY
ncbi:MAG: hypothetical protein M1819_002648 [Sarea resinae]|nr:MAG: hypothetical protein M1819_002648 [Sarea resinae]